MLVTAAGAVALGMVALGLVLVWLDSAPGRRWLLDRLNAAVAEEGIAVHGLRGHLWNRLELDVVTIGDAAGPYLRLEELSLSWRPGALFRRRLEIGDLEIARARLMRRPQGRGEAASAPDAPLALSLPDVDLLVRRFHVARFVLAEEAYGTAAVIEATGRLGVLRAARLTATFTATRLDRSGTDSVRARLAYDVIERTLDLSLEAEGRAHGLLSTLLAGTAGEAVELHLAGSGRLDAWQGRLDALYGARTRLQARLRTRGREIDIAGEAAAGDLAPAALQALLAPGVGFRVRGTATSDGRLDLRADATFTGGTLHLEGALDPEDLARLDLALELKLADMRPLAPLLAPLLVSEAALEGRWSGTLGAPRFAGTLRLAGLARPGRFATPALLAEIDARKEQARISIVAQARARTVVLGGRTIGDVDLTLEGGIDPATRVIELATFTLDGAGAGLRGEARIGPDANAFRLAATLAIDDLATLLPDSGMRSRAAGAFDLERGANDEPVRGDLELTLSGLASGSPVLDRLFAPAAQVRAAFDLSQGTRIDFRELRVRGPLATLGAQGRIEAEDGRMDVHYRLSLDDLGALFRDGRPGVTGKALLEGGISGPLDDLEARVQSHIDRVDIQGLEIRNLTLAATGRDLLGTPHGRLDLAGDSLLGALRLATGFTAGSDRAVDFGGLRLALGAAHLAGDLRLDADGLLRGELGGKSAAAGDLAPAASPGIAGDVRLHLAFDVIAGVQAIDLAAEGSSLTVPLTARDSLHIAALTLDAGLRLDPQHAMFNGGLSLNNARLGLARLERLDLAATSEGAALRLLLGTEGDWRGPLALTGTLLLARDAPGATEARLDLSGTLFGAPLALAGPARIKIGKDGWRLEPLGLDFAESRIDLFAERREEGARLKLGAKDFPLAFFNRLLPRPLPNGTLAVDLDLQQEGGAAGGTIHLGMRDLRPLIAPLVPLPPVQLDLDAQLADGRLALTAASRAGELMDAHLTVAVPLGIDLATLSLSLEKEAPLAGRLSWNGALAPVFALSGEPALAAGDLALTLDIGGRVAAPRLEGRIVLEHGRFEHVKSGFVADDIAAEARLDGRRMTLESLSAGDGNGGRLAGSGWLELSPAGRTLADLSLDLSGVQIMRRPDLRAVASGRLRFLDDSESGRLTGDLAADRVELLVDRKAVEDVATIDVIEINAGRDGDKAPAVAPAVRRPLALDLGIKAPRRLFVHGRGLESEWGADLHIGGSAARPRISGTARLIKGTFDFLGQRFDFNEGTLLFDGSETVDPVAHLVARQLAEGLDVTLTLDGPISKPKLQLTSTPALPEDEIVARLLFGASVASLTPIEGLELASTLAGLAGGSTFDIIGNARSLLGLDRLSLAAGSDNPSAPRITGGKYLSDKVYFEVATDTGAGTAEGMLEWSLTRNLSIASRVRSDQESSIRIRWSWSY